MTNVKMVRRILEYWAMRLEYEVETGLLDLMMVKMRTAQIDSFEVEGWVALVAEELQLRQV